MAENDSTITPHVENHPIDQLVKISNELQAIERQQWKCFDKETCFTLHDTCANAGGVIDKFLSRAELKRMPVVAAHGNDSVVPDVFHALDRLYSETVELNTLINVLASADLKSHDDNENGLLGGYCETMESRLAVVQDNIGLVQQMVGHE